MKGHPDVVEALHAASGGNPFLTQVLVDELKALGLPLRAPETATRVALAGAVAVLGSHADPWQAAALAEIEDLLAAANVIVTGECLEFAHPVVREAVLTSLGPIARASLHARAAKALWDNHSPPDRVAAHLVHAPKGTLPDAADTLRRAAAQLMAAGDPRTASSHLQRAVEERPHDAALRAELGRALLRTGDAVNAHHHLKAAAAGLPDAELVAAAASATAVLQGPQAAIEELTEAIAARPDGESRLHLEARLAVFRSFLPDQRQIASAHLSGYAGLAGSTPDERTLLGLLAQMGRYEVWPHDEVAAIATRALANGAYLDDATGSTDAMVAWLVALLALMAADGVDVARREIERARLKVRAHGSRVEFAMVTNASQFLNWRCGNMQAVEAEAEGALAAIAQEDPVSQVVGLRATSTHFAAYAALERGDVAAAQAFVDAFDSADTVPMMPTIWLHEVRGLIALARNHPAQALQDAYRQRDAMAAVQVDPPTIPWRGVAVRALLQLGEPAAELTSEQLGVARRWGAATEVGAALRLLAHATADARLELLTESVETLEGAPARLELARSLVDLGEALRVARWRSDAREPLHRAIDLAAECGSVVLRARAVEALEALGDRPRRHVVVGAAALTASERRGGRPGRGGPGEPGDRAGAVRDAEDRREPPRPDLHEARHRRSPGPGPRARLTSCRTGRVHRGAPPNTGRGGGGRRPRH